MVLVLLVLLLPCMGMGAGGAAVPGGRVQGAAKWNYK